MKKLFLVSIVSVLFGCANSSGSNNEATPIDDHLSTSFTNTTNAEKTLSNVELVSITYEDRSNIYSGNLVPKENDYHDPALCDPEDTTPDPQPEPIPDPQPEPIPDPQPEPIPDPQPEPIPDPQPEPIPDPQPEPPINDLDHLAEFYGAPFNYSCDRYNTHFVGPFGIATNAWGIDNIQNWSVCAWGGNWNKVQIPDIGWKWNIVTNNVRGVAAYPFIGFGYHPWCGDDVCRNVENNYLPKKVSNVDTFNVDLDATVQAQGQWNVLLEIWLSRTNNVKGWQIPNHVSDEIGWFYDNENWPMNSGEYHGLQDFGIDGKWHVYNKKNHKCWSSTECKDFIQFRPHEKKINRKLHMKIWLDYMVNKGWIDRNHYLIAVQVGNEMTRGSGELKLNKFNLEYK